MYKRQGWMITMMFRMFSTTASFLRMKKRTTNLFLLAGVSSKMREHPCFLGEGFIFWPGGAIIERNG